jgi:hypothetical protein
MSSRSSRQAHVRPSSCVSPIYAAPSVSDVVQDQDRRRLVVRGRQRGRTSLPRLRRLRTDGASRAPSRQHAASVVDRSVRTS